MTFTNVLIYRVLSSVHLQCITFVSKLRRGLFVYSLTQENWEVTLTKLFTLWYISCYYKIGANSLTYYQSQSMSQRSMWEKCLPFIYALKLRWHGSFRFLASEILGSCKLEVLKNWYSYSTLRQFVKWKNFSIFNKTPLY